MRKKGNVFEQTRKALARKMRRPGELPYVVTRNPCYSVIPVALANLSAQPFRAVAQRGMMPIRAFLAMLVKAYMTFMDKQPLRVFLLPQAREKCTERDDTMETRIAWRANKEHDKWTAQRYFDLRLLTTLFECEYNHAAPRRDQCMCMSLVPRAGVDIAHATRILTARVDARGMGWAMRMWSRRVDDIVRANKGPPRGWAPVFLLARDYALLRSSVGVVDDPTASAAAAAAPKPPPTPVPQSPTVLARIEGPLTTPDGVREAYLRGLALIMLWTEWFDPATARMPRLLHHAQALFEMCAAATCAMNPLSAETEGLPEAAAALLVEMQTIRVRSPLYIAAIDAAMGQPLRACCGLVNEREGTVYLCTRMRVHTGDDFANIYTQQMRLHYRNAVLAGAADPDTRSVLDHLGNILPVIAPDTTDNGSSRSEDDDDDDDDDDQDMDNDNDDDDAPRRADANKRRRKQ